MRTSTRFPIAVHTLMIIAAFTNQQKVNSDLISQSTGVNPVIIRNIFTQLKKANLISVSPGPGGTTLTKKPQQITLWDIFTAVETKKTEDIFRFHGNVSPNCPIGSNVHELLYSHLDDAVEALKKELSSVTIADLIKELRQKIPDLPEHSSECGQEGSL
ncbi:MAG: Rrf2 family transcriptional regulator [Candidatus Bathyarchaeota archaeon]|nr:Rrf2 family transcriptional regulator [Candidatus Bathyarchaeota archaeon]